MPNPGSITLVRGKLFSVVNQRGCLVLKDVKNGIQSYHLDQLRDAFCRSEKRAVSAALLQLRVYADNRTDTGTVHFRHSGKIDGHVPNSFVDQLLRLLAERLLAFAEFERTGQIENRDRPCFANRDGQRSLPA